MVSFCDSWEHTKRESTEPYTNEEITFYSRQWYFEGENYFFHIYYGAKDTDLKASHLETALKMVGSFQEMK